jgi:iron-sulfur cluster repair protein YtfE (RIC family)
MTIHTSIQPDMTVAHVVEVWPAAMPVLARHGVDLCCGGTKTLGLVAQAHGLDLQRLIEELTDAVEVEEE